MRTQRISRGAAFTLLSIMVGGRRYEEYARELDGTVATGIPSFVSDGCKVYGTKEQTQAGLLVRYYISGYSADGNDVVKSLARGQAKSPRYEHKLDMAQSLLWAENSQGWRTAARQMATHMARKVLTPADFARGDTYIFDYYGRCLDGWNNTGNYHHGGG